MSHLLEGVTWFRSSSVRIRRGSTELYIDPQGIPAGPRADYILLTHPHFDSFSEDDIRKLRDEGTVVVAPTSMRKQVEEADHLLRPGDYLQSDGLDLLAVPAYNRERRYHPPDQGWVGYVFTLQGVTYYHAGDTDFLDSMRMVKCDVAFLPCGGRYTMGPEEAAGAAVACGASVVVPIRWEEEEGGRERAERLKEAFPGEVRILLRGNEVTKEAPDEPTGRPTRH